MAHDITLDSFKKISGLIEQQFPDFLRDDAPKLVAFIKAYYEWMEENEGATKAIKNLQNYRNVDKTLDSFIDWFHREFLVRIPTNVLTDRRLLVKHIADFYRAKGTQNAYNFLFRILYNEEVSYYYPGVDILRASHGKWIIEKSLKTNILVPLNEVNDCIGEEISGSNSGARSSIERIEISTVSGITNYELFISRTIGTWQEGETIFCNGVAIASIIAGGVITYPGRYDGTDGHISSDKYLQDNFYYQEFSYVLRVAESVNKYREIVKSLVHPAGTLLFGEFLLTLVLDTSIDSASLLETSINFTSEAGSGLDLVPNVFTNLFFSDPDFAATGSIIIEKPLDTTITTESEICFYDPIDGYFSVANSGVISEYQEFLISSFESWTADTFVDNTGVLGRATNWTTDLAINQSVIISDNDEIDPFSLNFIATIDSANTATIKLVYPYGDLANGSFERCVVIFAFGNTSGFMSISNTGVMDTFGEFALSQFDEWSTNTFTDKTGMLGRGTDWETDLPPSIGEFIEIRDNDSVYPNFQTTLSSIQSANTAIIDTSYPHSGLANGTVRIQI